MKFSEKPSLQKCFGDTDTEEKIFAQYFIGSDYDYDVNTTKMFRRVLHPCFARRACGCLVVCCKLSDSAGELASRFALL
jgi:hypothetical protein